jgi:DNA polymerase V
LHLQRPLAKVANKIAKKFPERTRNVYVMDTEEKRIKALKWLKVEDVWGIGRQYAKKFQAKKIVTAFDFVSLSDDYVRHEMSVVGLRLKKDLEGEETLDLDVRKPKQAIATTRSFENMYTDFEDIKERVASFAIKCSEKLRKQHTHCNSVMVFIHSNGFRKDLPQYYKNIVVKTEFPTHAANDIIRYAVLGLRTIFKQGIPYKKAGVIVGDLTPENEKQYTLFSIENPKLDPLMKSIDRINTRLGTNKVKFACQDLGRTWKMRQEKLSPRFTTQLNEVIEIHID